MFQRNGDIYKQLINAGASKKDASTYAFGFLTDYENEAQYLIDTVQKNSKKRLLIFHSL